jgi:hypothetical protein
MWKRKQHRWQIPARGYWSVPPEGPADLPRADVRIEDYLDHVCAPLVERMPYEARTALRAELRAHLESLADAYRELGSPADAAIHEALAQFGHPRDVAREWVRECERTTRRYPVLPAWAATLVALGCYVLAMAAQAACGALHLTQDIYVAVSMVMSGLGEVGTPLLAGLVTGAVSPDRPARGNFYAVALLYAAGLAACWVFKAEWRGIVMISMQAARWMLIGCGAAVFGAEVRKRREQSPDRWRLLA